jgi:hypothetical protein
MIHNCYECLSSDAFCSSISLLQSIQLGKSLERLSSCLSYTNSYINEMVQRTVLSMVT